MFDPTKSVQTRDGREVRIFSTKLDDEAYVIGAVVIEPDGSEGFDTYTVEGRVSRYESDQPGDLVNVAPRMTEYVNLGEAYGNVEAAAWQHENFPVLKIVREVVGLKVISTELIAAADAV